MANRQTLHLSRFEAFKAFLVENNIAFRPGKGAWQALQVLTDEHGWQCIHSRADMPEHYTVQDKLMPLVNRFLHNNRLQSTK